MTDTAGASVTEISNRLTVPTLHLAPDTDNYYEDDYYQSSWESGGSVV